MKRRIGLNILFLVPGEVGGTETYARGLIKGLVDLKGDYEFVLFVNQLVQESFDSIVKSPQVEKIVCPVPVNNVHRHLWEQWHLSAMCRKHSLDLLHSLGYVSPVLAPCKRVVSILDMLYKRSPRSMSLLKRLYWTVAIPLSARTADAVITISQNSKDDIVGLLRMPERKVFVTLLGPGQELQQKTPWEVVKDKYGLPEDFFLSVG